MSDCRNIRRAVRPIALVVVVTASFAAASQAGSALVVARDVVAPDAFIALGSHEWERLPVVAELARREPNATILLTEPVHPTAANCHLCGERGRWLQSLGVAADRVVVLPRRVGNTRDEAAAVAEWGASHALGRLVVVTSPYHARRALAVFEAVLGDRVRLGVHPAFEHSPASPRWWWSGPYDRAYVSYEWAALAWYAVRYGVSPFVSAENEPPAERRAGAL